MQLSFGTPAVVELKEGRTEVVVPTPGEVWSLNADTGKLLRCHALVWHSQLAPWVESTNWTADALRTAIKRHIDGVAGHWKGRCYAWDVEGDGFSETIVTEIA